MDIFPAWSGPTFVLDSAGSASANVPPGGIAPAPAPAPALVSTQVPALAGVRASSIGGEPARNEPRSSTRRRPAPTDDSIFPMPPLVPLGSRQDLSNYDDGSDNGDGDAPLPPLVPIVNSRQSNNSYNSSIIGDSDSDSASDSDGDSGGDSDLLPPLVPIGSMRASQGAAVSAQARSDPEIARGSQREESRIYVLVPDGHAVERYVPLAYDAASGDHVWRAAPSASAGSGRISGRADYRLVETVPAAHSRGRETSRSLGTLNFKSLGDELQIAVASNEYVDAIMHVGDDGCATIAVSRKVA